MNNKSQEMNELETLARHPTRDLDEEITPFLSNETRHSGRSETSDKQRNSSSRIPSFKLSAPVSQSKVTYLNEKERKKEEKLEANTTKREQPPSIFGRNHKFNAKGPPRPPLPTRDTKREFLAMKNHGSDTMSQSRFPSSGSLGRKKENHDPIPPNRYMERPTQHHTFIADPADVRQIENGLLQLMEEFHVGNLRAFGKDSRLRQMEEIREQQEKLARLHFEVGAQQEKFTPLSEEGLRLSEENMRKVMEKLAQLSESIENLHTNSHERKTGLNVSCSDMDPSRPGSSKLGHNSTQPDSMVSSSSSDTLLQASSRLDSQSHREVPISPHSSTKTVKAVYNPKSSDDR